MVPRKMRRGREVEVQSDKTRHLHVTRKWLGSVEMAPRSTAEVIAALNQLSAQLTSELGRVIGDAGVAAIFARSLHKLRPTMQRPRPAAATSEESVQGAGSVSLTAVLEGLAPAQAEQTAETIIVTFIEVLISVIGDSLAWQLLRGITPPAPGQGVSLDSEDRS